MKQNEREDRSHFVRQVAEALAEFLSETIYEAGHFSFFGSRPKVGLGREELAQGKFTLLLRSVETTGKPEDETYESESIRESNRVIHVTKRSPWIYQLRFDLVGPSLETTTGMSFAGKIHSVLFDHPELPTNYLDKRNLGFLPSVHLKPTEVSKEKRGEEGELGVVASMRAEFLFATGSPVAVDQTVATRDLSVATPKRNNTTKESDI